jgi:hypothetical protein
MTLIDLWVLLGFTSQVIVSVLIFPKARTSVGIYRYSRAVNQKDSINILAPDEGSPAGQLLLAVRETHVVARQEAITSVASFAVTVALSLWLFVILINHLN